MTRNFNLARNGQKAEASSPFVRAFCSSCHGSAVVRSTNSLATRARPGVRIPLRLRASGIRDTVWVLSPPNLYNRTNAPECQPSLPSRSRSAQIGQQAEPFVRAFCSSCHDLPEFLVSVRVINLSASAHSPARWSRWPQAGNLSKPEP
jgi:hypothetical protein